MSVSVTAAAELARLNSYKITGPDEEYCHAFINSDNTVKAFGIEQSQNFGRTGNSNVPISSPLTISLPVGKTPKRITSGEYYTLVLFTDGTIQYYGRNKGVGGISITPLNGKLGDIIYGSKTTFYVQCTDGTVQYYNGSALLLVTIPSGKMVKFMGVCSNSGNSNIIVCTDNTVYHAVSSENFTGEVNLPNGSVPVACEGSAFGAMYIILNDGTIYGMGALPYYKPLEVTNTSGNLYSQVSIPVTSPEQIPLPANKYAVSIVASYYAMHILCNDNTVITFGAYRGTNYLSQFAQTETLNNGKTPVAVTSSTDSVMVLYNDGTMGVRGGSISGINYNTFTLVSDSTVELATPPNSPVAPVLTAGNTIALPSIPIDPIQSENTGKTIASIIVDLSANYSDNNVSDPRGIAIVSVPDASYGMLQYKVVSTWVDISNVSSSAGLLLDASASIRFAPASGVTGFFTFTFKAWDKSTGTVGSLADTTYSASGSFSQNTATGTVTVAQPIRIDIIAKVIVPSSQNIATVTQTLTTTNVLSDPSFATVVAAESSTPVQNLAASVQLTQVEYTPVVAPSISGTISVPDISEGIVDVINTGFTIQQALNIFGGNYVDTNSTVNKGLLITGINAANGAWQYKTASEWTTIALSGDEVIPLLPSAFIRFVPTDDNIYGVQNISVKAWNTYDGSNGTKVALTTLANNTYSSSVATINMNVSNVNDRPRLVSPIDVRISTITSSITDASNAGITVASIYTTIGSAYSEVDPEPNVKGLLLTGFSAVGWQFKEPAGSWTAYTAADVSNDLVALVSSLASIRFMPSSTAVVGGFTVTYKLWDQVQGVAGTKVSLSTLGESYSIGNGRLTTVVAPINNNLVYGVNMTFNIKGIDNTAFITNPVKQTQLAGLFADALATDKRKVAFSSFKYIINQNGTDVYQNSF